MFCFLLFGPGGVFLILLFGPGAIFFFAVWAGGRVLFLLFGRGRVFLFAVWARGRVLFFAVWAGGVFFFLLFGRGTGVHSLTRLPGSSLSDPTTKETEQQKKTRVPAQALVVRRNTGFPHKVLNAQILYTGTSK